MECEIVHRITGRLRLRIPRLGWDTDYANRLQRLNLKTNAITESRINRACASLIISYQEEKVTESAILDYLQRAIQSADKQNIEVVSLETKQESFPHSLFLPSMAMIVAIAAIPLELPFIVVGGVILLASLPLWQRVGEVFTQQGELTVDCLDALWLSAQLIQGNGFAAGLAVTLSGAGETLRRTKLEQLENELYGLFKEEEEEIHWLCNKQKSVPLGAVEKERWMHSVEETELMQQVKPMARGVIAPTLLLSAIIGLVTGELARASAILPLDMGVSLRGATPLAVVSSLTTAARNGIFIRNGKILETLAQVDTLVIAVEDFPSLKTLAGENFGIIGSGQNHFLDLHIVTEGKSEDYQSWMKELGIPASHLHFGTDRQSINLIMERLHSQEKKVAWLDLTADHFLTTTEAEVMISLARGEWDSQAEVILYNQDLGVFLYSLILARHTMLTAYQSLAIAIIPNLVAVTVGVVFGLNPIIAVLINGGCAILAELNSIRPP